MLHIKHKYYGNTQPTMQTKMKKEKTWKLDQKC